MAQVRLESLGGSHATPLTPALQDALPPLPFPRAALEPLERLASTPGTLSARSIAQFDGMRERLVEFIGDAVGGDGGEQSGA